MKKMKKAISVILTAAMIMSMGVTAFADTTTGDDTQSTVITTTTISDYKSAVIDNEAPINFTFTKTYKTSSPGFRCFSTILAFFFNLHAIVVGYLYLNSNARSYTLFIIITP